MCGRYTLTASGEQLASLFGLDAVASILARYNIAPGQTAPVVMCPPGERRVIVSARWGVVTSATAGQTRRAINARSETAQLRRSFSGALARRRCLVPANGFFEWGPTEVGRGRTAHLFHRSDEKPFAIAGLFDGPETPSKVEASSSRPSLQLTLFGHATNAPAPPPPSCTFVLLTTRARGSVERVHDRMPVIVEPESFDEWLDPDRPGAPVLERLRDANRDDLVARIVSSRVGDVRNDDPDCIRPADRLSGSQRGFSG